MRRVAPPLLVALVAALVFAPALRNGFVDYDDNITLTDNPDFRGLSWSHLRWMLASQVGGHWQPLAWLTFAVDHAVWGMDPFGYHLTALAFHVVNAVLVYLLLLRLVRHAAGGSVPPPADDAMRLAAAVGALVWAVHPLRVEVVAWATERRLLVGAAGALAATLAWLRVGEAAATGRSRAPWIVAATAAGAASLLAAPWAVTLPAVFLVLDAWPLRRLGREPLGRLVAEVVPLGAVILAGLLLSRGANAALEMPLEIHGPGGRLGQAAWAIVFYLRQTAWPVALSPYYPLRLPIDPTAAPYAGCLVAVGGVTAVLAAAARRWPAGLVAWVVFLVVVFPALGVVQAGHHAAADRYTYLATIPLVALVTGSAALVGARGRVRRTGVAVVATAVLAVLGTLTVRQIAVWHDSTALWTQALAVDPDNGFAHLALGGRLQDAGRVDEASAHYAAVQADAEARPDDPLARQRLGVAMTQVARESVRTGDVATALVLLRRATQLAPRDPWPFLSLGALATRAGRPDEAVPAYEHVLALDPASIQAMSGLAGALLSLGRLDQAEAELRKAIAIEPGDARLRLNLGDVLARAGRTAEARAAWQDALDREPDLAEARERLAAPAP